MNLPAIQSMQGMIYCMTMAEKGISSAKVILTGLVVVFAMLVLLIFIIKLYSAIVQSTQKSIENKKKQKEEAEKAANAKNVVDIVKTTETVAEVTPALEDGISEEVVAVISAAVATLYGSSTKAKIKGIKKAGSGRSAWANAGLLDNTRPF